MPWTIDGMQDFRKEDIRDIVAVLATKPILTVQKLREAIGDITGYKDSDFKIVNPIALRESFRDLVLEIADLSLSCPEEEEELTFVEPLQTIPGEGSS